MSWLANSRIATSYRTLGARRFWSLVAAILAWIAIGAWLSVSLKWPDAYGLHCHGRGCWVEDLRYSPRLLARGHSSAMEIALFAWQWSVLVIPVAIAVRGLLKKRPKFTIFEPQNPTE